MKYVCYLSAKQKQIFRNTLQNKRPSSGHRQETMHVWERGSRFLLPAYYFLSTPFFTSGATRIFPFRCILEYSISINNVLVSGFDEISPNAKDDRTPNTPGRSFGSASQVWFTIFISTEHIRGISYVWGARNSETTSLGTLESPSFIASTQISPFGPKDSKTTRTGWVDLWEGGISSGNVWWWIVDTLQGFKRWRKCAENWVGRIQRLCKVKGSRYVWFEGFHSVTLVDLILR